MVVAGVMSGTSADGVDVAVVRVLQELEAEAVPRVKVLGHRSFRYPREVREAVLGVMNAGSASVADLSRLHWRLGEVYANCVEKTCRALGFKIGLVGMHGQTIYHQGRATRYLGKPARATWQIGEAAVLRERLGVPVVSDFRPADLAAGGQGAPLVPMLDYCLFRHRTKNRVLLNLGGIANLTAIPAGAGIEHVMAFDTGPANMVVDALMEQAYALPFDKAGRVAARGRVSAGVMVRAMKEDYFAAAPPKSCGREEFGEEFVERFEAWCKEGGLTVADEVATATELTAATVTDAYGKWCWAHMGQVAPAAKGMELVVAGGGVKNDFLMGRLREEFGGLGVKVLTMEELGVGSQAKEAMAFALLGWLTWEGRVGNVPSATGARQAVVLGKVSR